MRKNDAIVGARSTGKTQRRKNSRKLLEVDHSPSIGPSYWKVYPGVNIGIETSTATCILTTKGVNSDVEKKRRKLAACDTNPERRKKGESPAAATTSPEERKNRGGTKKIKKGANAGT